MARSRNFNRGSSPRRRRVWARSNFTLSVTDAVSQLVDLGAAFRIAGGDLMGATVGPIFMNVFTQVTTAGVAGWMPVAVAIGNDPPTAADFNPTSEPFLDWMLYDSIKVGAGAGDVFSREGNDRVQTQSMRKMEELQQRPWLVLGPSRTGTSPATVKGEVSMLVILP